MVTWVTDLMQIFLPQYTMNGLEIKDIMSANGSLHTRVLRGILPSRLSYLQPLLYRSLCESMSHALKAGTELPEHWTELKHFSLSKEIIAAANSQAFFGSELSNIPEFIKAALEYPEDLFKTAEVLRLLPKPLAPAIAPILMRRHRASNALVSYLTPVIESRLKHSPWQDQDPQVKPADCIQFFIDANSKKGAWTTHKLIQVLLGMWFAALHQPALLLTYALEDLCDHPQYIEPLRKELRMCDINEEALDRLPLLDSFLKESARLHPSDSIALRRKVLQTFHFSDGTTLFPGDVACVPLQAIMQDPSNYVNGTQFDGKRFLHVENNGKTASFTDPSPKYPLWGLGKHGW